ncbi:AIPR family protein [Hymenobacter cellulosilyticus]|uniref:AIPR family protein n=1 Tax=Hymenobacter cellulosilyticus TaxID=2932248 RepID=A0A8T9QAX9_9BACT|nr:AIPR family protein [Hymenobacter cellulosilyticus]UOQ72679.1 AIPR family protein [Hymenobacter cellulosilyticus]
MENKYNTLVNILDQLRTEAPAEYKRYHALAEDQINVEKGRALALIHLFLKVKFGLTSFFDREALITDGTGDGGVDAYYIDKNNKVIYFIQSKFRNSSQNFEQKQIQFDELLSMDIDRLLEGEMADTRGIKYSSKINSMIGEIKTLSNIAKYTYSVLVLANIKNVPSHKLQKLTGFATEVYNFERSYNELVFPVVTGTYYNISDLFIYISLTNKAAGPKISYSVKTEYTDCNITALFVPTIEIAKILYKYKNSILKYNPRSYLGFDKNKINIEIAETILKIDTNEFALYNNGITMLSDSTNINERIGEREKAQLTVNNPQIINGGQTAYTLSKLYEQLLDEGKNPEQIFGDKEVLLKVITFIKDADSVTDAEEEKKKIQLIESVSKATNQQTPIDEADRRSNDLIQIELQKYIYNNFGFFYNRKRGEFADGIKSGYITKDMVIDRDVFLRVALASTGNPTEAKRISGANLFSSDRFNEILKNTKLFDSYFFAYKVYLVVKSLSLIGGKRVARVTKTEIVNYGNAFRYGTFAVVSVVSRFYNDSINVRKADDYINQIVISVLNKWTGFEEYAQMQSGNGSYFQVIIDQVTGKETIQTSYESYYKGSTLNKDLKDYFFNVVKAVNNEFQLGSQGGLF